MTWHHTTSHHTTKKTTTHTSHRSLSKKNGTFHKHRSGPAKQYAVVHIHHSSLGRHMQRGV